MFFGRLFQFSRKQKPQERPAPVVLELRANAAPPAPTPRKKEPAVSHRKYPDPVRKTPRQQARRLLEYLAANGIDGEIRPDDLKDYYVDMCIDLYWHIHHWNVIAKEFTAITTKKKVYRWIVDEKTGAKHRLRVYPVRAQAVPLRRAA